MARLRVSIDLRSAFRAAARPGTPGLAIVDEVPALQSEMSRLVRDPMRGGDRISPFAPEAFTTRLNDFMVRGTKA